jgi:hypothetical protein
MDPEFDHPVMHWPRAGVVAVVHTIEAALAARQGFSLIRLGDGEGSVMAHDAPDLTAMVALCRRIWFGDQPISTGELDTMRLDLIAARQASDIVGLPRYRQCRATHGYLGWQAVVRGIGSALAGRRPVVYDMAMHNYLQWSGGLARLLRGRRRVLLITCRDIGGQLAAILDIGETVWQACARALNMAMTMPSTHIADGTY